MGWTSITTKDSFEQVFQREFADKNPGFFLKHIELKVPSYLRNDGNMEESEFFCAVISRNKAFNYGYVILFARWDDQVAWKEMDETSGPFTKLKCPKEILNMLSPLEKFDYAGYAEEWRKRQ